MAGRIQFGTLALPKEKKTQAPCVPRFVWNAKQIWEQILVFSVLWDTNQGGREKSSSLCVFVHEVQNHLSSSNVLE